MEATARGTRMRLRTAQPFAAWCVLALSVAACGGGDIQAASLDAGTIGAGAIGAVTIGAAGGTALGENGAQVVFPKGALRHGVSVRIAEDSTGAPALPAMATPASAVYTVTPHGGDFEAQVEVSIPVDWATLADNEQLLLATAAPGDTSWRVLSGATFENGSLRAPVMHFSFFQAIVVRDRAVPQLVATIGGKNNTGADGAAMIAPDYEFKSDSDDTSYEQTLIARLRYPQPVVRQVPRGGLLPQPLLPACLPTSLGHGGAEWRFVHNGHEMAVPPTAHWPYKRRDPSLYPRFEGEYGGPEWLANEEQNGFGALHFYGQDSPRRGEYAEPATPQESFDVWALPPANNVTADDVYSWRGNAQFSAAQHTGRMRVDVTIPTDCGLTIEAVPLSFQLNLSSARNVYVGLLPRGVSEASAGSVAVLEFYEERIHTTVTATWEYSTDPVHWQGLPVPAEWVTGPTEAETWREIPQGVYSLNIPNVQPGQAGYYRAVACATNNPSLCIGSTPAQLLVRTAPPDFTGAPRSQTVQAGETASFTVVTFGAPPPTLQWQQRAPVPAGVVVGTWTDIANATAATFTTAVTASSDNAMQYRVIAQNAYGSTASEAATLTVVEQQSPPLIVSQPGHVHVTVGGTAVFAGTASGPAPLSFQWRHNGSDIPGANSAILTLGNVTALNEGRYELVVSNRAGSATSDPAELVVTPGTAVVLPPTIAAAPVSITVAAGDAANFAVAVTGTGPYSYQWLKNGVNAPLPGGNSASFGMASVTADDAGTYTVRVTNSVGSVDSAAATLTVGPGTGAVLAPTITTAPVGLTVLAGGGATFAAAVAGTAPFSYQWRLNGVDVAGGTGPVLHLAAVSALDAGPYVLQVSNDAGVATSTAVQLTVIATPAIAQQPAAATATEGAMATFSVVASGDGVAYQWTRNQLVLAGETSASYTTPPLTLADNGAVIGVIVYNGAGLVVSQGAVLTVN